MKTLDLSLREDEFCIAIAVEHACDILITNQTGGTACAHPSAQGIPIPLPSDWLPSLYLDPLYDLDYEDYEDGLVIKFLRAGNVEDVFEPLPANDARRSLGLSEAWVPVRVRSDLPDHASFLTPFVGECFILTYHNSD